jgi:hypothetical protein
VGSTRRTIPAWILAALEQEMAEARLISCPRARRVRELEIDVKADTIRNEILYGEQR